MNVNSTDERESGTTTVRIDEGLEKVLEGLDFGGTWERSRKTSVLKQDRREKRRPLLY